MSRKEIKDSNKAPSDINEHNIKIYYSKNRSRGPYYCTKCEHRVTYGGSFSNQGFNLECSACVREECRNKNMDTTTYLRDFVWEAEVPEKYQALLISLMDV